jgi:ligand-binding sensor domain-containing protein/signal transduction histidine kinase/CheY-like chemotaxis protein/AraC-like DNA-binding protein
MCLMRRLFITLFILPVTLVSLKGQTELRFENYYIEDGLPHSRARAVIQDSEGWIWIATGGGLARFDGTSFKTYHPGSSPDEESMTSILCFWEDSDARLWIGTEGDGLLLYDRRMDRFQDFVHNDTSRNCISGNTVYSICSDSSGIMWIGTNRGLNRFDPLSGSFQWIMHQDAQPYSISSDTVNKVFIDKDQRLWIGTGMGLDYRDPESGQFSSFDLFSHSLLDPLPGRIVQDLHQDEKGNILVASYYSGLFIIDSSLSKTLNILPDPDYMRSYLIRSVFPDQNGELWLGTRGGIYILDAGYNVIAHHANSLENPSSLGHNSVSDIYRDRYGDMWIATRSGISYTNLRSMAFKYYGARTGNDKYLNDPEVYSIFQSSDGKIWLGTEAGGINILDKDNDRFSYLTHSEINLNTIAANSVKSIIQDRQGNFWIGSFLGGLDHYLVKEQRFIHYTHDPDNPNSLINNTIWTLLEDRMGHIWIGTDEGVQRFEPRTQRFFRYKTGLKNHPVHIIYEDQAGNLYFGSNYNELVVMQPDSKLIEFDISTRAILEDSKGRIWIGSESNNGLIQFDYREGIVKTYKTSNSDLPSNQVYGILEDDNSMLWISTGQGLSRFNPETEEFKTYKAEDGIQGDRFYYGAYCKCKSGEMLFGGQNGLTLFDPNQLKDNQQIPPIVITDFKIFNKEVPVGGEFEGNVILEKSISQSEEIVVKYKHSVLTFEYVALNYLNSTKNEYAYMLEGFERDWNYVGQNRSATYTNLDPGSYVFRVKGSNNNGIWNEAGTSLGIVVTPPFTQTLFFKTLMVVLTILIIYLIILFFIKREKLKNQLVLERVRSKELHKIDMMKFQFFTNISHEIRTPISLIVSPLARIKNTKLPKKQILKDIDVVHRNALRLGKLVDQLLDYRKLEAGKLKLELSRGNIVSFLENVLYMFKEVSTEKKVDLRFFSALDQMQIYFDADKIEKVMFNLLSNSFKHTPSGGTINVSVSQTYLMNEDLDEDKPGKSGEYIQIVVRDTGRGIEESKREQIFDRFYQGASPEQKASYGSGIGLSLSKELIKIHKGRIKLKSQVGVGTEVTLLFPVIKTDPNLKEQAVSKQKQDSSADLPVVSAHADHMEQLADAKTPVILVLEDNKDLLEFIKSIFEEEYMVLIAEDGEAGLDLAMETIPDLVISDVMMPKLDGIKLCKKLKQDFKTSHIPLIMLTALSSKQHEKEGILGGADEYITKPFDPSLLKIRADQLLATRRLLREKYSRENLLDANLPEAPSSPDDKFLAKLVSIIEDNISDPEFGTVKISREVGVSRTQLYRKMAALTEMTVKEFIRSIRLKKAAQLIAQDHLNISEAAYAVGFLQVAYFRKCFKEMYGMTPSEYAKTQAMTG